VHGRRKWRRSGSYLEGEGNLSSNIGEDIGEGEGREEKIGGFQVTLSLSLTMY